MEIPNKTESFASPLFQPGQCGLPQFDQFLGESHESLPHFSTLFGRKSGRMKVYPTSAIFGDEI